MRSSPIPLSIDEVKTETAFNRFLRVHLERHLQQLREERELLRRLVVRLQPSIWDTFIGPQQPLSE